MAKTEPMNTITELPIEDIRSYVKNAKKHPKAQVSLIANSITEFGFNQPIVVDKNGVIIVGHGRYEAAKYLGLSTVPVLQIDLAKEQANAYRIADNKLNESSWDNKLLYTELIELSEELLSLTGFTELDLAGMEFKQHAKSILRDDFIIPPLSIWDSKQEYWQERKRLWREVFGDSRDGRNNDLLGEGLNRLASLQSSGKTNLTGTSEFDPVVAEVCYRWFCPEGGKILDPFAGGAVRGAVAGTLGYEYTGIDLSAEQVKTNKEQTKGIPGVTYVTGNSLQLPKLVSETDFDFVFSCPPYFDLEVYSEDPTDLSNKGTYQEFLKEYSSIIKTSIEKLKPNRFAVFVVGDIRDDSGFYHGFVPDTIKAFLEAGAGLYNDVILANALATATLRVRKQFQNRKIVKVHQNVLCFFKADKDAVAQAYAHLPQIEQDHKNVLVFYKGDLEQIHEHFTTVKTEITT